MNTDWHITHKADFFETLGTLPAKEALQVIEKINLLAQDPTPDGKVLMDNSNDRSWVIISSV